MVQLRDVRPGDLEVYLRLRTDPRMMAELGGPQDPAEMAAKVARDVEEVAHDRSWVLMILPDDADPALVAGTVNLWSRADGEAGTRSEIGWMVLPEHQGRGLATAAVWAVLRRAAEDGRWGAIHAYPAITNEPSNRLCRRSGFLLAGEQDTLFRGRVFRTNHWVWDPAGAEPGPA